MLALKYQMRFNQILFFPIYIATDRITKSKKEKRKKRETEEKRKFDCNNVERAKNSRQNLFGRYAIYKTTLLVLTNATYVVRDIAYSAGDGVRPLRLS